jgi:type IV/VI secretion system ImpK/VasF family protein
MPFSNPDRSTPISLTDLCEPFFLEVGKVIRSTAENGGEREAYRVRDRLLKQLELLRERAEQESASLKADYDRIEPVLAYFADDVINASTLPFASQWVGEMLLASDPHINVRNGREQFFHELAGALREPESRVAQRLAIFQTCLGLGFAGIHFNSSDKLRAFSEEILDKLDAHVRSQKADEPMCPEAYEKDDRELFRPVRERVMAIGLLCFALVLATLVSYFWLFFAARQEIANVLGEIIKSAGS